MMMLGNLYKRVYLAIMRTQYVLARHAYQASPMCGHWVAQHGVRRGSLDPVPAPALKSIASGVAGRASLGSGGLALGSWQGLAEPRCPHVSSVAGDPSFQGD